MSSQTCVERNFVVALKLSAENTAIYKNNTRRNAMEVVSADTEAVRVQSAISWAAIIAGATATAALTLVLVALGAGLGLSAVSPWNDTGASAATFKIGTGIYVVIIAVMSSAIGGYLAARLRNGWVGLEGNEVFFRDTAAGFLAWALATLISAGLLAGAVAHLAGGTAAAANAHALDPARVYVDRLFRSDNPAAQGAPALENAKSEVDRLWTAASLEKEQFSSNDRAYMAQLVSTHTGLSAADAAKRVDDVVLQAKADADKARRGAAQLSLWLTAALLFGAFASSLAAVEGGQLRDGTWNGERLIPRPL
jgi:hypothetical protein